MKSNLIKNLIQKGYIALASKVKSALSKMVFISMRNIEIQLNIPTFSSPISTIRRFRLSEEEETALDSKLNQFELDIEQRVTNVQNTFITLINGILTEAAQNYSEIIEQYQR